MKRGRRALLLLALAGVLGSLAASDVAQREAALASRLGDPVPVVVAGRDLAAGRRVQPQDLAIRHIPERYAPVGAARVPEEVTGGRLAVPAPRGAPLGLAQLAVEQGAAVGRGERAVELVGLGSPQLVVPGARVDVLVTPDRADGRAGRTRIALEDVEVLDAHRAEGAAAGLPSVAATLRVGARDALRLADELAAAREVRLLPRP